MLSTGLTTNTAASSRAGVKLSASGRLPASFGAAGPASKAWTIGCLPWPRDDRLIMLTLDVARPRT
ncbi:hypothetical protein D3C87_1626540 [compost metagenome]